MVGATTVPPGGKTTLVFPFVMHPGMGGPHLFKVVLKSNDPKNPTAELTVRGWAG